MTKLTPKDALQSWANKNHISPAEFGRKMGYSYNHAYQLMRGEAEVTIDMLGRFMVAYGADDAKEIAAAFQDEADMDGAVIVPLQPAVRTARPRKTVITPGKSLSSIPGLRKGVQA